MSGHARSWSFQHDGALENAAYVATRQVHVRTGPSAGKTKTIIDFKVSGEPVSVWPTAVLKRQLKAELELRGKPDFEAGERMTIVPTEIKTGSNGFDYQDFAPTKFEHAASRPTAASLLKGDDDDDGSSPAPPPQRQAEGPNLDEEFGSEAPWGSEGDGDDR